MSDTFGTPFHAKPTRGERKAAASIENQRRSDDEFLRNSLKSRAGRDYFWRLIEQCHAFEISYQAGSFDMTAFREGERNIGQKLILDIVRVSPESWIQMMQERAPKRAPVQVEDEEEDENA